MSSDLILSRLRRFLLILSGLLCLGTVTELWFIDHTENWVQLIPFVLCGLGLLTILIALFYPRRKALLGLAGSMGVVVIGSLFGLYEHIENNIAFQLEISPHSTGRDIFMAAFGGANPILAPGILALAAILAIAATYYHPGLGYEGGEKN